MDRLKGIAMIVSGASLWGATGPMMEWLLRNTEMSVSFMITIRLFFAGVLLLLLLKAQKRHVMAPWRQPVWARQLLIFGVLGMLGVQYSFAASIEASDAVLTTLFQFLAPIYIIIFVAISQRRVLPVVQMLAIFVTLVGLGLLLTDGTIAGFSLSRNAVFWGVMIGFAFSFYTLYPVKLMHEWGVLLVVAWAMVIGGIVLFILNFIHVITQVHLLFDWGTAIMLLLVIIFGTAAFSLFLGSMTYLSPIETSVLSCFEPLTAIVITAVWFGKMLGLGQFIGAIVMLLGVTWLSIAGSQVETGKEEEMEKIVEQTLQ